MEKIFYIDDNFVDSRLDRWFKKNIFDVPQSLIEKNLRKGNIKVNKKKVKSSYKLKINDKITLYNIEGKEETGKIKLYTSKINNQNYMHISGTSVNGKYLIINHSFSNFCVDPFNCSGLHVSGRYLQVGHELLHVALDLGIKVTSFDYLAR